MARQSMVLVASWRRRSVVRLFPSAGARPPILGLRVVSSFSAYDPVEALLRAGDRGLQAPPRCEKCRGVESWKCWISAATP